MYTDEQIKEDKAGTFEAFIAVYDNFNLEAATKRGTFNKSHGVIMPGFTENVQPFIGDLSKENNFLRFVFPSDLPDFSIEWLVENAKKTRACIKVFIANYYRKISYNNGTKEFHLSSDYKKNTSYICSYGEEPIENNGHEE